MDAKYLYRVLRPDENPHVGIVARHPESWKSLEDHLTSNDNEGSKFISTCKTLKAAQAFASDTFYKYVRIIEINVQSLLSCNTVRDIIDMTERNAPGAFAKYCVTKYQEVLIVGEIPPGGIENVSLFAPTNNIGTRCLYRVLRDEEDPQVGIYAKKTESTICVEDHIRYGSNINYQSKNYAKDPDSTRSVEDDGNEGSKNSSKYISTSKTLIGAQKFAWKTNDEPVRIAVIDADTLLNDTLAEIIDLTNPLVMNRYIREENKVARRWVEKFQEVLIVGNIPAKCIVNVYLFWKDDLKKSLKNVLTPTYNMGTQYLYRVLRPDENPQVGGIFAKDPVSTRSVEDHVNEGSYNSSKYISTSKTLIGAQTFALYTYNKPVRIAVIDVDTLLNDTLAEIIDLTNPLVMNNYISVQNEKARRWAVQSQEVLIVGYIPATCIVHVHSFSEGELKNAFGVL